MIVICALLMVSICGTAFCMCGMCGTNSDNEKDPPMKNGVKEITYDQFVRIRSSGEKYVLLDVLSADSYNKAHIEGAISFPLDKIDKTEAEKMLSKDDKIVVYCGSFQCTASTEAAKKLSSLGYNVFDYKGGLKEWRERGNKLIGKN